MTEVNRRSEIVFLYDIKDGNPNGDPLDENKPRIDEETGINLVTDVRFKRTIRDHLYKFRGKEIFVREISDENGSIQDAKMRARDFLTIEEPLDSFETGKKNINGNLLNDCIDVRLFGGTVPLELKLKKGKDTGSITHTGPVQFKIGRSMHKVFMKHFRGTGAFASKEGASQKTFREEDFLPYSFISFYGIINENAAKDTKLSEEDIDLLLDGMWNGTKNLISRSKVGQVPRLLFKVNYKEGNYHIGDLNNLFSLKSDLIDEEIRDISQIRIEIQRLVEVLGKSKDKIENAQLCMDGSIVFTYGGEEIDFEKSLMEAGINTEILSM
ncbi:type I-B CRISPR-associated protein Cas7/Csh2 [Methanosarcina mazei]|uniref:CRISPR-associated protein Csh2 n=1 Tax=Methanosarcina mazei TaxID=2209 RepID=A0A0F8FDB6_METMZ|nr:type I-B CRISPR-associated protein Cas7/Csh2 [Methanosarcina mazei]KKG32390.1 CRISPR-associated protein Csh2 [Methanosarcina mazei]KKG51042.1 CRISPR-associated protein Csh2 [Methanosarcina mazei]KKG60438.1 CRISPR-associated protein Csh2 [Methanosarcina mazei]KKG65626.1 CRISPR-associated protein Csh2 [Methanosarcina mazei]KKG74465.1 CRISPR-associated protein Csh2 [Methanosarcina mazei]